MLHNLKAFIHCVWSSAGPSLAFNWQHRCVVNTLLCPWRGHSIPFTNQIHIRHCCYPEFKLQVYIQMIREIYGSKLLSRILPSFTLYCSVSFCVSFAVTVKILLNCVKCWIKTLCCKYNLDSTLRISHKLVLK